MKVQDNTYSGPAFSIANRGIAVINCKVIKGNKSIIHPNLGPR